MTTVREFLQLLVDSGYGEFTVEAMGYEIRSYDLPGIYSDTDIVAIAGQAEGRVILCPRRMQDKARLKLIASPPAPPATIIEV